MCVAGDRGLATLVAVGDPQNARLAPYIGFVALFAGLGALTLSVLLLLIGKVVFGTESFLALFAGYVLGGLSGAVFGLCRAVQRGNRIRQ